MMPRTLNRWLVLSLLLVVAVGALPSASGAPARTVLGVGGGRLTVNGRPEFLLGVSYFAGLGASERALAADLEAFRRDGFRWIRVWATWSAFGRDVSAVDGEGKPCARYFARLERLLSECDRRGLVVDVTLTRGKDAGAIRTLEGHERAVETLVTGLKQYRNWYLDLGNERNVRDARYVPVADLARLRARVRELDPQCLVTASEGGDIDRGELHNYLMQAGVDFIAPHRPRDKDSPAQTEMVTRQLLEWMRAEGRVVPILYQEPFRRGYAAWEPQEPDYLTDARNARRGGASGWCFHNGAERGVRDGKPRRSFDLTDHSLLEQLDPVELGVLRELRRI